MLHQFCVYLRLISFHVLTGTTHASRLNPYISSALEDWIFTFGAKGIFMHIGYGDL